MIPTEDKKAIYKIADMPMPAGKITDRDMLETMAQALALLSLKVCIVREMLTASPNKATRAAEILNGFSTDLAIIGGVVFRLSSPDD